MTAPATAFGAETTPANTLSATQQHAMNQLGTVYATKRRRRNGKSLKPPPKDGVTKSNPSKRHRERLNSELDMLASLLPYEQNILSKLDRLSILRLSVSYLRTKSYFQVVMHKDKDDGHLHHDALQFRNREMSSYDHSLLDGDMFLQALNGFLLILTCEGEVFFATHSIESYLGFHQSDIVHQSVYELVHSEDREELQRQLMWNSFLPPESSNINVQEVLHADNCHLLERSFTVRFRCLLDNTSGFLRLDIRGRIKVLHGQNRKTEEAPLALFAICTPFGPPSLLEIPQKEVMFKSKHKLDLTLVSMDQRGKMLLGYSDSELANLGGYDLVHFEDLAYVASAHQELLKTGASGMIAYRFQTKEGQWQWLQTSSRLVYKNSKPDFVISTHRPLMEEEGRDLLGKRTMDFKVSYLDAGLNNSYFTDSDQLVGTTPHHPTPSVSHHATTAAPQRVNRRYKTQLRDFLSTCRTKRKLAHNAASSAAPPAVATTVDYITATDTSSAAAAAVAAAYSNLNTMYTTPYQSNAVAGSSPDNGLYMGHSGNFHQSLYPAAAALDNRFLAATTENLFHQYRPLGTYYPDYHHAAAQAPYVSNGFLDISPRGNTCSLPTYDTPSHHMHHPKPTDDKLYSCQQLIDTSKYEVDNRGYNNKCLDISSPYSISPAPVVMSALIGDIGHGKVGKANAKHSPSMDGLSTSNSAGSSPTAHANGLVKMEDVKSEGMMQQGGSPLGHHQMLQQSPGTMLQHHYSPPASANDNTPRQTVLMWGSGGTTTLNANSRSPPANSSDSGTPVATTLSNGTSYHQEPSPSGKKYNGASDPLKSLADMNSMSGGGGVDACKWGGKEAASPGGHPPSPMTAKATYHHHHLAAAAAAHHAHHPHLGAAYGGGAGGGGGGDGGGGAEVWHQYHHQYYPYTTQYHHHAPHSGSVSDNGYPQISRTGVLCCPSLR